MKMSKSIPSIECQRTPEGQLKFWCEHCRKEHFHGGGNGPGDGDGHRVAHCHTKGAYPHGYILKEQQEETTKTK